jgi:hypothetical protein
MSTTRKDDDMPIDGMDPAGPLQGFDWSKIQGIGALSPEEAAQQAGFLSEEDKRAIRDGAKQEMANAKDDMWALVEHYMQELVKSDNQSISRDSAFFGLWSTIAQEVKEKTAEDPDEMSRLARLLHTAISTLAEAADENLSVQDGSRRQKRSKH